MSNHYQGRSTNKKHPLEKTLSFLAKPSDLLLRKFSSRQKIRITLGKYPHEIDTPVEQGRDDDILPTGISIPPKCFNPSNQNSQTKTKFQLTDQFEQSSESTQASTINHQNMSNPSFQNIHQNQNQLFYDEVQFQRVRKRQENLHQTYCSFNYFT